jgi:RNA polymerase sigma factor (sigma-70 family)
MEIQQAPTPESLAPEDSELLSSFARTRNEAAFRTLVSRHAGWVYAAAFRQLRDRHLAEDATQAVFILLSQKAKQVAGHQKISGWLFVAVSYTVRSMKRAEQRRHKHETKAAKQMTAAIEPMPPLTEELDAAVARLGAADRAAIVLRFYQGMELKEVGRELGVSSDAARQRVSRAVARLRRKLGAQVTVASVAAASSYGMHPSPAALEAQMTNSALGGTTGAGVSTSVGGALKGAVYLMAITKAKIAIAVVVSVCAAGFVTTKVVKRNSTVPQTRVIPAAFERVYGLKGEAIRRVSKLSGDDVDLRTNFLVERDADLARQPNRLPQAMLVKWKDGKPNLSGWSSQYTIQNLIQRVGLLPPWQLEGDKQLMNLVLHGDLVINRDAGKDQLRAAIAKVATEQAGYKINLTFREVERPVVVLKGVWDRQNNPRPALEFYVTKPSGKTGTGSGTIEETAQALSNFIERRVVIECQKPPAEVLVYENSKFGEKPEVSPVRNPAAVIKHIEEQTGLTAATQIRRVPVLFIERG